MERQSRGIVVTVAWVAVAIAAAVGLAAAPSATGRVMAVVLPLFFLAMTAGIIVRLVRSRKGSRLRNALGPVAGAADAYQQLLLGRDSFSTCIEKSFSTESGDVTAGGLPPTR